MRRFVQCLGSLRGLLPLPRSSSRLPGIRLAEAFLRRTFLRYRVGFEFDALILFLLRFVFRLGHNFQLLRDERMPSIDR